MKLPASVRIGPYQCRIVRKENLTVDGDGCFGSFDYNTHEIELAAETDFASEALEASALLHESIHGILHVYKIKLPDEEDIVEKLETALLQFFKDNKTAVRTILKALK